MSHESFPRRVDLAIWCAALAFLGLAVQEAVAVPPAATAVAPAATPAPAAAPSPRESWQRECGDCHIAYPPRLLPAADWRRIVETLDRHFGVDASLDAAATATIAAWLEANAGRPRSDSSERRRDAAARAATAAGAAKPAGPGKDVAAAALPRISTTPWFRHEHDDIAASTWQRPAIGSAARCEACHTDAAQGRFSEHALRIPR